MIGTDTGPLGDTFIPVTQGARAWVADVNARGGLNGHRVRLVAADDGGDPGRALELARQMIERDKVVAFYGAHGPGSSEPLVRLLEERQIPTVGTCNCAVPVGRSPMNFDIGQGAELGMVWAHLGQLPALSDKRKMSFFYCREVPTCQYVADVMPQMAKAVGVEIVHMAQVTLSQPDYTAEVLAARNAGAEAISMGTDSASTIRIARSAHRQNWNPVLVAQFGAQEERLMARGGADLEGAVIGGAPPWDSPQLADYKAAMRRYVPGSFLAGVGILAWGGGKLLEAASKNLPDRPTSADILKGLYALNGETLGGLTPPLTFAPGQPYEGVNYCIYPQKIQGGKIIAPKGNAYVCAPGWKPRQK